MRAPRSMEAGGGCSWSTSSRSCFTLCRDEAERAAFVAAIVARRRGRRPPSWWPCARTSTRAARVPGAGAAARRQPRARRPAAARRAAAGDRAARRSGPGCASSPSSSTGCWRTSSSSRARCRCSRPPCSSCGSGATAASSRSPATSAAAGCAARSRGSPRPPTRASTRRNRPSRGASCCGWPVRTRAAAQCGGAWRSTSSRPTTTRRSAMSSTCSPPAGSSWSAPARWRWRTRRCCASGRGSATGWRRTPRAAGCTITWRPRRASGMRAAATRVSSSAGLAWRPRSTGPPGTRAT